MDRLNAINAALMPYAWALVLLALAVIVLLSAVVVWAVLGVRKVPDELGDGLGNPWGNLE